MLVNVYVIIVLSTLTRTVLTLIYLCTLNYHTHPTQYSKYKSYPVYIPSCLSEQFLVHYLNAFPDDFAQSTQFTMLIYVLLSLKYLGKPMLFLQTTVFPFVDF